MQPNVQSLFVQDNCIRSFFGLDAQPKLEVYKEEGEGREEKGGREERGGTRGETREG